MKRRKKAGRLMRRGAVLATATFLTMLLLVTGVGLLALGRTARIISIRTAADVGARGAADAGLTKAIWVMNKRLKSGKWDDGRLPVEYRSELPNSDATYSYIVVKPGHDWGYEVPGGWRPERLAGISAEEGDYLVISEGRYRGARRVVYGTVGLRGCGEAGVLVREKLVLKADTRVDGRDSRDPNNRDPDVLVEIGTLSTAADHIVLNRGVVVDGNVLVGVGGDVETVIKDLGAKTGLRYALPEDPELPPINPWDLDLPNNEKPIEVKGDDPIRFTEAHSGRYTGISLKQTGVGEPGILEIASGDVVLHITGDINLGTRCEIVIEKGATLNLYVDGNIKCNNDSGFNNQGAPPDLKLWGKWPSRGTEQEFQLNAKSKYFGQLYAPGARVTVMAKGDLYGAFTAKSFEMKSSGNLFYDGALSDVDPDEEGVRFVLKRWRER